MGLKLSNIRDLDDSALVERIQYDDDRKAFSELVRRHQAVVYRSCYRVLGNREDARDASQEAFSELTENWTPLKGAARSRPGCCGWR